MTPTHTLYHFEGDRLTSCVPAEHAVLSPANAVVSSTSHYVGQAWIDYVTKRKLVVVALAFDSPQLWHTIELPYDALVEAGALIMREPK